MQMLQEVEIIPRRLYWTSDRSPPSINSGLKPKRDTSGAKKK